ncbi:MAG: LD-carboxypeptidase [Polyangiaceae bacterium]
MNAPPAEWIFPPAVRPGDRVAVIAPSSPFDRGLVLRGMAFLKTRYDVRFEPTMFARAGYLAGTDARRLAELEAAIGDPEIRAIVAARGGYGASRFVHDLDWRPFEAAPKWIVGFSDITAIHVELARRGFASIHGPHVANVGRSDAAARAQLVGALEFPRARKTFDGLRVLAPGNAVGPLVGGNLSLLHASAAAGKLRLPAGCVLFVEDVGERPYRVDRMLTTLRLGGHFEGVAGIALGDFTQCDPGPDRTTITDVFHSAVGALGVPVVSGLPCGHEIRNEALVLGSIAALDATKTLGRLVVG